MCLTPFRTGAIRRVSQERFLTLPETDQKQFAMALISNQRSLFFLASLIFILLSLAVPSPGATVEVPALPAKTVEGGAEKPVIDVASKDLLVLYRNEEDPIIERFSLTGELALQWAAGTSNCGSYGSWDLPENSLWGAVDVRRWRLVSNPNGSTLSSFGGRLT